MMMKMTTSTTEIILPDIVPRYLVIAIRVVITRMVDDFKEHDNKGKWITAILLQTKEGDEAVLGDPQVGDLRPPDRRVHHGWSWQR